jgi:uncharacterized protein (TIGR00730 family)
MSEKKKTIAKTETIGARRGVLRAPNKRNGEVYKRQTSDEILLSSFRPDRIDFKQTDPWRVLRIMGEFVEGFDLFADLGPAVTIFGSARVREDDPMYAKTVEIARLLGKAGFSIITGGGPGIMQAGNQGAKEAGALSVGLNIELPFEQNVNPYCDVEMEFHYFFTRKTMFLKYAQAYVICPGGFGTMDEFFEALVLIQNGKVRNFPVVLFGTEFWGGLMDWMREKMAGEGKIASGDLDLIYVTDSPKSARDFIVKCLTDEMFLKSKEEAAHEATRQALKWKGDGEK